MSLLPVVSPEFDFAFFCGTLLDQNPAKAAEAASAEISYSRTNHREATGQREFRKGSKGRIYCDNLMTLVRLLMNGQMPESPNQEFLAAISPLMRRLLAKWRIGELDIRHFQDGP
jgi:hypothetical protein